MSPGHTRVARRMLGYDTDYLERLKPGCDGARFPDRSGSSASVIIEHLPLSALVTSLFKSVWPLSHCFFRKANKCPRVSQLAPRSGVYSSSVPFSPGHRTEQQLPTDLPGIAQVLYHRRPLRLQVPEYRTVAPEVGFL